MNPYRRNYRRDDPDTARAAGEAVVGKYELWQSIAEALEKFGPLTTEQLAEVMERPLVSISPRMVEMEMEEIIRRQGKRKNRSGRQAIVWALRTPECPRTDQQAVRDQIVALVDEERYGEALSIAYAFNVRCQIEWPEIVI